MNGEERRFCSGEPNDDGSVTLCDGTVVTNEMLYSSHVEEVDITGATVKGALWDRDGFIRVVSLEKDGERFELIVEEGDQDGEGSAISLQRVNNDFKGKAFPIEGMGMMAYEDEED